MTLKNQFKLLNWVPVILTLASIVSFFVVLSLKSERLWHAFSLFIDPVSSKVLPIFYLFSYLFVISQDDLIKKYEVYISAIVYIFIYLGAYVALQVISGLASQGAGA